MENRLQQLQKARKGRLTSYLAAKRLSSNSSWPLNEQAAAYILCFGETLGFYGERVYQGHTLNHKNGTWLLVVRCTNKGKPEVAFMTGERPAGAIRSFAIALVNGLVKWQPDRFAQNS